jgi:membrane-bound lytic murein transglycosylase A
MLILVLHLFPRILPTFFKGSCIFIKDNFNQYLMKNQLIFYSAAVMLLLNACSTESIIPFSNSEKSVTPVVLPHVVSPDVATLKVTNWSALPGWEVDDIRPALDAFLQSCNVLRNQKLWVETCNLTASIQRNDNATLRKFFEHNFKPYQVLNSNGGSDGLITGYYEPLLKGSRKPSDRYRFPLYTMPKELLVVDLGKAYPKLKHLRLRGRLEGQRIVPYYSRAEIEGDPSLLQGYELLWVEDAIELFFLQIQGSGRIETDSGEIVRVGYHNQNGHSYRSIGKLLVERGELSLDKASMQGIKAWGIRNPGKLNELLHQNPSYVFFRELPAGISGPIGALGVSLTAGRSLAIDPRVIPQGAPVFLSTTWPNSSKKLHRLMIAQDTGGAIKGGVRADFFWGFGKEAANQAGKMKQIGKMWVLMPNSYVQQALIP